MRIANGRKSELVSSLPCFNQIPYRRGIYLQAIPSLLFQRRTRVREAMPFLRNALAFGTSSLPDALAFDERHRFMAGTPSQSGDICKSKEFIKSLPR
ncbi:hypothetical protein H6G96_29820 [Nostoc sp. FACHB-892]|uniref:hypothetical protein n=1 Tax=Nostoc sp. FACHB-892 TaxID=2692843 RepID=UPI001684AC78|nr:hypothetical protein [Nostoc sp. FACHB-892]MBD2730401.1 hypothetical protein [Nostoc sp. FACHB-892]